MLIYNFTGLKGVGKVINVNCPLAVEPLASAQTLAPESQAFICSGPRSPASLPLLDWTLTAILDFVDFLDAKRKGKNLYFRAFLYIP